MTSPPHFTSSDAWLLHAIGMSGQASPATLRDILAVGDFINHVVFTWDEIASGLNRLMQAGLVEGEGQGIKLAERFAEEFARLTGHTKVVYRQGEVLSAYLQALTLSETKKAVVLPITESDYVTAVQKYQSTSKHI